MYLLPMFLQGNVTLYSKDKIKTVETLQASTNVLKIKFIVKAEID